MTAMPPSDGHAGDLVSAHLDGELDAETTAWVDAHLVGCEPCRRAAAEAASARDWMHALPPVDATPVVESVIARRHRLIGTGLAFVGVALFALGILAMTASVIHPRVVPEVDALVAAHELASHGDMDGMEPVDDAGAGYAAPEWIEGPDDELRRVALYDRADLTTVVYGEALDVSVFQQPGRLDWDELPDGSTDVIGGREVWIRPGTPAVVVTEVGHLVVTTISDDGDAVRAVVAALPAPHRDSILERVHDSCQRLTEIFALGG